MRQQLDEAVLSEHRLDEDIRELSFQQVVDAATESQQNRWARVPQSGSCEVCNGLAGPLVDVGELGQGQGKTFTLARGFRGGVLELAQIPSTFHDEDFDSLPPMDVITVLERAAKVEQHLIAAADDRFEVAADKGRGWLVLSKRKHPEQHGNLRLRFLPRPPASAGRVIGSGADELPASIETGNPVELTLGEFRGGLTAAIPMRPASAFETIVYFRPSASGRLCDLTGNQRWGLAQAIREVTGALRLELQTRGHPVSYRWTLVAGPGIQCFVRIRVEDSVKVEDSPAEWASVFRDHLGLH